MDVVDELKSAHSFHGDPLHRKAWEEIERLKEKITEMNSARFMHDVIGKANWNQVCKENEALRERVVLLEGYLNGALNVVEGFVHFDTTHARKALREKE